MTEEPSLILILGASGHGRVIAEMTRRKFPAVRIAFLDDRLRGTSVDGIPCIGGLGEIGRVLSDQGAQRTGVVVGVGDNWARRSVVASVRSTLDRFGAFFTTIVDPSVVVSPTASLAPGTVIMPNVAVNAGARIGAHVILNTACSVDHDCIIDDYAHVSPGASIAGAVHVGQGTQIGVGSSIIQNIKIGSWTIIGAGSAVVKDILSDVVAYGVPAKPRRNLNGGHEPS